MMYTVTRAAAILPTRRPRFRSVLQNQIAAPAAKDEQMPGERILPQHLLRQQCVGIVVPGEVQCIGHG